MEQENEVQTMRSHLIQRIEGLIAHHKGQVSHLRDVLAFVEDQPDDTLSGSLGTMVSRSLSHLG